MHAEFWRYNFIPDSRFGVGDANAGRHMIERKIEDYIRVTDVLYPFSGLEKIDATVLENAARRGTRVHQICEGIISGLGEIGVDDETWGYIESFKKWWEKGIDVVTMEERFFDDELRITGQVDLIIRTSEGLAVVDLKTSSRPSKTWPLQGGAYSYLAINSGYDIKKIYFLHLNKHGKEPKIFEYVDDGFFLSVLKTFKYFFLKG